MRAERLIMGLFTYNVDGWIREVQSAPTDQRRDRGLRVVDRIQRRKHKAPKLVAPYLESAIGVCFQEIDEPFQALEHFETAINIHPVQTEASAFPTFVQSYLDSLDVVLGLPKDESRRRIILGATQRMEGLVFKVPSLAHDIHKHMGVCFGELGQLEPYVEHAEKALLLHPDPTPESDYPLYEETYLTAVKDLAKFAVIHLKFRGQQRDQAIFSISRLTQSLERVTLEGRSFMEMNDQYNLAWRWFNSEVKPHDYQRLGLSVRDMGVGLT